MNSQARPSLFRRATYPRLASSTDEPRLPAASRGLLTRIGAMPKIDMEDALGAIALFAMLFMALWFTPSGV